MAIKNLYSLLWLFVHQERLTGHSETYLKKYNNMHVFLYLQTYLTLLMLVYTTVNWYLTYELANKLKL